MDIVKIKNLLLYFAENTSALPITKAMKLFFYADFMAFAEIGKSITGLDYHCWDQGPVPPIVHKNLDKGRFDFVRLERIGRAHLIKAVPGVHFEASVFSGPELDIMTRVLSFGRDAGVADLSAQTHRELPWAKTERYEKISYEWAVLQKAVMTSTIEPADEEIIMDVISRSPALHHFYEAGLADWLDASSDDDADELLDESDLTPVHWEKEVGWVQGH
jgi:uncharacterized phage-associated protein